MTRKDRVADEALATLLRREQELNRRVLEGTLHPALVDQSLQGIQDVIEGRTVVSYVLDVPKIIEEWNDFYFHMFGISLSRDLSPSSLFIPCIPSSLLLLSPCFVVVGVEDIDLILSTLSAFANKVRVTVQAHVSSTMASGRRPKVPYAVWAQDRSSYLDYHLGDFIHLTLEEHLLHFFKHLWKDSERLEFSSAVHCEDSRRNDGTIGNPGTYWVENTLFVS